jgi:hypothetical protein
MKPLIALLCFAAALEPQTAPRTPQFDNPEVKVWKSTLLPNVEFPLHRHDHPRVIVALTSGTIRIVPQNGAAETHQWEAGKAYWLDANPPGQSHVETNIGDKPLEVMVVELEKAK